MLRERLERYIQDLETAVEGLKNAPGDYVQGCNEARIEVVEQLKDILNRDLNAEEMPIYGGLRGGKVWCSAG